jgi:hypothetical protein
VPKFKVGDLVKGKIDDELCYGVVLNAEDAFIYGNFLPEGAPVFSRGFRYNGRGYTKEDADNFSLMTLDEIDRDIKNTMLKLKGWNSESCIGAIERSAKKCIKEIREEVEEYNILFKNDSKDTCAVSA